MPHWLAEVIILGGSIVVGGCWGAAVYYFLRLLEEIRRSRR